MKLYGLFFAHYDYYEWLDLVCVSDSKEKLKNYHSDMQYVYKLYTLQEHYKIRDSRVETPHYFIESVKYV